ncbi:protein sym-1 [Phtheirospermum japonicum]|uniref:Protein sym-1 n=1 Tax=Phtheirospermum japonicum TaxID=374723 RepID=A0A830CJB3_9LAMI|nr:protein sym-1 [Phtheirospermum japonicum]
MISTKPLSRNSHLLLRCAGYYRTSSTTCHINTKSRIAAVCNPIHFNGSFARCYTRISSLPSANGFKVFGRPEFGFENLGLRSFRVSSGGGSGGGFGGSGGGSSGGGGGNLGCGGAGGGNWSLLSWYLSLLANYPVMTKAVTSAFLTLVGDLICQLWIDQVPSLELKRTFIFTLLGLVLVGPTLHFWYFSLSKLVTTPGASGAIFRLLLDQFLFAPTFIGLFLSTLVTLEGRPSDVIPKLRQEWFSSVLVNWQLWIPFQFFNFRFVPQQFQVLAANFIALIWNVILSYKAHKEVVAK